MRCFLHIITAIMLLLVVWSVASGVERFPPPDFVETDHTIPSPTVPGPRQDFYEYVDVVVLLAALG
jgi:hypothetical protein